MFPIRVPLSKAVMLSVVVTAIMQSIAHSQATVTESPATITEGAYATVSFSANIQILSSLGSVQLDGPATCMLNPGGDGFGSITLTLTTGLNGDTLSGKNLAVSTSGINPGTYTATCNANYWLIQDIEGREIRTQGSVNGTSGSFVINGTGSCTGTEGTATIQPPPNASGPNSPLYSAAITLPFTTNPGSSSSYSTNAQGVSDTSPYVDCDGDTIYYTGGTPPGGQAPKVANGAVEPEQGGPGTVTFNWTITPYRWPAQSTLTACDCSGDCTGTCDSSGIDNPSTVVPVVDTQNIYAYTKTASCTSN